MDRNRKYCGHGLAKFVPVERGWIDDWRLGELHCATDGCPWEIEAVLTDDRVVPALGTTHWERMLHTVGVSDPTPNWNPYTPSPIERKTLWEIALKEMAKVHFSLGAWQRRRQAFSGDPQERQKLKEDLRRGSQISLIHYLKGSHSFDVALRVLLEEGEPVPKSDLSIALSYADDALSLYRTFPFPDARSSLFRTHFQRTYGVSC